uniref:Oxysterol-binding protein n=1 Tax=Esox lucius TaxID=8010 RepID=A0A6Q2ZEA5_ESOLU
MDLSDPEEQLLHYAKTGSLSLIHCLLQLRIEQGLRINVNCKGKTKASAGWTPIHLASYFGHKDVVEELLKAGANVNLQDNMGDTPLHKAASTGRKEVVLLLLRYNASPTIINGTAQIPKAVTEDDEVITMLEAAERREERRQEEKLLEAAREGDVFSLSHLLSKKNPPDIHCRDLQGNTPLHCAAYRGQKQCVAKLLKCGASVSIKNKCGILLPCPTQSSSFLGWRSHWVVIQDGTLSWYPTQADAVADVHKQGSKALINAHCRVKSWDKCFFSLQCFDHSLHHFKVSSKTEPEKWLVALGEHAAYSSCQSTQEQTVNDEEDDEYRSLANLTDSLQVAEACQRKLDTEVSIFLSMIKNEDNSKRFTIHLPISAYYSSTASASLSTSVFFLLVLTASFVVVCIWSHVCGGGDSIGGGGIFKTSLPAPMFSRNDVSIWSILKKCIGMELSKIAMPVIFNEPLSFLQRLTEYMEHTYLIHQANATPDSVERMKCVAAFAVSAVASQWERTGKPFNPLLGETYELIREDLGFRWISEQVSHHPPVSAFHAEGLQEDFLFHGSIYPKLKFWGKSVEAEPKGVITLELPNEAYTWTNPTCCVHNIIVGQLWIEQYGTVEVVNHKTGERCSLTFKPCGLFGKELHKVEGYILDKSKKKLCAIYGKWTECLYTVDAATFDAHKKADKKNSEEKKSNKQPSVDEEPEEMPLPDGDTVQVIPGSELIWRIAPRPDNSAKFYAFSTFAMQLNELEEGMKGVLPITDCRLRPDIKAMENGDIDLASAEKKRVEEKQRLARKNRSKSTEEWKTRWFHQGPNPHNKAQDWLYSSGYWDRNYTLLPDIY